MSCEDLVLRIKKWNQDRNGLKFDSELELKLLSEELHEVYMAESVPEKVHELCDLMFVIIGTYAKSLKAGSGFHLHLCDYLVGFADNLIRTINVSDSVFDKCLEAVLTANERKGKELNSSGKVTKGKNHISPLEEITNILKKEGVIDS